MLRYVFFFSFSLFPVQNGAVPHDNLVLIKMKPDENGRFGFNVKVRLRQKRSVLEMQKGSTPAKTVMIPVFRPAGWR